MQINRLRKQAIKQLKEIEKLVKNKEIRLAAEQRAKWKILVSTILSSQTRDETTIKISNLLYKKYPNVKKLAYAKLKDVRKIIKPINFYKTKSKNIIETAKLIRKKIPETREELMKLTGVGWKVSNVYLYEAHNKDCVGVDVHVSRISRKLAWTKNKDKHKIELDLEKLFPKKYRGRINPILVKFGRIYGKSRKNEDEILRQI
jgi:endonuclease-3